MPFAKTKSGRSGLQITAVIAVLAVVMLLPWWRNHAYLTDFYDYGLVISGVGRLGAGEHLYVDIVSPIQSAIFLLNTAAEKIGGGTFQAMTLGGACMIAGATAAFVLILHRRWPLVAAVGVVVGIVSGSVTQHTIIWHNATGVVCLALVVWGTALAPVLRSSTWPWHVMVVAGLWLSGINKLNFHIVALAVACGWTLRAGLTGGENGRKVATALVLWIVAGILLPFATELIWTGATPAVWWYNVVALPLASRASVLGQIFTWKFQVESPHIYYGTLRLPQIGLVSIVVLALTALAGLRQRSERGWGDRMLLIAAVLLAISAGAALHATNFDIPYVGLASSLVLAVSLWLGFGLVPRGPFFLGGLVIPSLLIGAVAWESAWRGQRSQFGHSSAARELFLPAEMADPAFAYLRGTYLPPEMHDSLGRTATWVHSVERNGLYPVFYGPGIEWLERIFPAVKPGPMPLLAQWGATYGPGELKRLDDSFRPEGCYSAVLSVLAWDTWTTDTAKTLEYYFGKRLLGGIVTLRERCALPPFLRDAVNYRNQFGGNTASLALDFNGTAVSPYFDSAKRAFLGSVQGNGLITLNVPIRRMEGEAVVHRRGGDELQPVYADFRVVMHNNRAASWGARLELPAGQQDASLPFWADGNGEPLDLAVEIPPEFENQIAAGYRNPRITDTGADEKAAPYLRLEKLPDEPIDSLEKILKTSWRPDKVTLRWGMIKDDGVELWAGGELWMYAKQRLSELSGEVVLAPSPSMKGSSLPFVRVVWYKAGRFEMLHQELMQDANGRIVFRAWSAEPDGWFGILMDPASEMAPALVRVLKAEAAAE